MGRQKKNKHLRMTVKADVFLKDGDTSYTISLDTLDMALLPIDKLLNKYSGNQQTAIWSLDTYSKEVEYLDEWDELCEFEVQAMKRPDPVKDCIFCHICQLNIPKNHIKQHNDSEGHSAMLQMAFRAADRINKHMIQEKKSDLIVNVKSAVQSYYYCATCNMFVDISDTNHHNEVEHRTSLKRHKLHIKFYEKYEQLGGGETKSLETIELKVEDVKEKTKPKETHLSNENSLNIKKEDRQKQSVTNSVNNSCFCSVCDMHIPNTKQNINEHFNGKTHRSNIVRKEEHKTETASKTRRAGVFVAKSYEVKNSNVVGTASVTRNNTTARSIQNSILCDTYVPNTKHNINEHVNSNRLNSNIVRNEEHKTETASETRRARVLVPKSYEVMTYSNVVGTASVTRNNTTARSIQNSILCDTYVPNTKHTINEHVNYKTHNSNIIRIEEHITVTASETKRVGMLVPKSYEAKNSNVVSTVSATLNDTIARSIQNSILCDTYVPNTKHNINEQSSGKTHKSNIVISEEHKTETASEARRAGVLVSKSHEAKNSNGVGTASATENNTTARSIQNSILCDTYVPNTKHNINEHSSGKTHKSDIVINEEHKTETASEARRAGVLVSKSHEAMTNCNVVGTASASRIDTTARNIQNSSVCDTFTPKHNVNEHNYGKGPKSNIVRNEEFKTETTSATHLIPVTKSVVAMTNSNVVGTAFATRHEATARSIQNSSVCDTFTPKHNVNEHNYGKGPKSNIVLEENHNIESASETRVLVTKLHETITSSNVACTASATRSDTTERIVQNTYIEDEAVFDWFCCRCF